jgi:hypothetical protein
MQQQAYTMSYPPSFMQGLNSSKVYGMNRSGPMSSGKPLLHVPSTTKAPSPHMYLMPEAPSDEGVTCSPIEMQPQVAPFDAPADRPEVVAARQDELRAAFANRLVLRVHNIPSGTSEPVSRKFVSYPLLTGCKQWPIAWLTPRCRSFCSFSASSGSILAGCRWISPVRACTPL